MRRNVSCNFCIRKKQEETIYCQLQNKTVIIRQKYLLRGGVTMIGMGGYHESVQGGTMDRYIQRDSIITKK